jgi:hypothetical protein
VFGVAGRGVKGARGAYTPAPMVPSRRRRAAALAALALAAVALAVVTRLPFADRTLFISDSVRYALAIQDYDLSAGRPHPPGNPLYVGLAKAVDAVVDEPPVSLALLSALLSGAALLFAWLLGRDVGGEQAGWLTAGILLTSALFWFFGCVAMPATGEAALSLAFAWTARRARAHPGPGPFWVMTAVLAAAFGFRSTFAVLVLPLWLYAAWRHPRTRRMTGLAALVLAFLGWTWLVASLSGGWDAYRETTRVFFSEVVVATKILGGGFGKVPGQTLAVAISAVFALGPFLVPMAVGAGRCMVGRYPFPGAGPFLAAWALPMLAFHLVYDWAPRFAVPLLAPAALLAATTALAATRRLKGGGAMPQALVGIALAANAGLFLLPTRLGAWALPDPYPGGPRLLARNAELAARDEAVRREFPPDGTLVLAYEHAMHAAWFLPEHRVVGLFPVFKRAPDAWVPSAQRRRFSYETGSTAVPDVNPLPIPPEVRTIVLFDEDYLPLWPAAELPLSSVQAGAGGTLRTAAVPRPGCLAFGYRRLEFVPAGTGACPGTTAEAR